MHRRLASDKDHAAAFFSSPDIQGLIEEVRSIKPGAHLTPQGRELLRAARAHFGYASRTNDHDLLRPLIRHYDKWVAKKGQFRPPREEEAQGL